MAQPLSVINTVGQSIDTVYNLGNTGFAKLAVGDKTVAGLTPHAAWQGVASHQDGDTFAASDGVEVVAGVDGTTVRKFLVDALGRVIAVVVPTQGSLIDKSGALAAGNTAEDAAAANTTRKYLFIQNIDATEDLWFNLGVTAVADKPSMRLGPGDTFVMEASFVSTGKVSVIAATTGHKWVAKEA